MKKKIIKTETVEIIEDIICNKCGESCKKNVMGHDDYYGLIEVGFSTGYASRKFSDGCYYQFSLCEECLAELFDTFKIDPLMQEGIF